MKGRAGRLARDVHALARAYHWTEPDVFRLSCPRRLRYLGLLEEEQDQVLLGHVLGGELP